MHVQVVWNADGSTTFGRDLVGLFVQREGRGTRMLEPSGVTPGEVFARREGALKRNEYYWVLNYAMVRL